MRGLLWFWIAIILIWVAFVAALFTTNSAPPPAPAPALRLVWSWDGKQEDLGRLDYLRPGDLLIYADPSGHIFRLSVR